MADPLAATPLTLQGYLQRAASLGPTLGLRFLDRHERETRVNWPEVLQRAAIVAGGLRARGVLPGETVAIVLATGPTFFDAFFGALLARAVPVPLYPPVRLGRLDEYHARTVAMLTAARARILLTDDRVWRILGVTVEQARLPLGCVRVDEVHGPPLVEVGEPDDLALVQFSSGTTVAPKPIALTHRNILANVLTILAYVLSAGEIVEEGVSWLPLYHDMGLTGCVFPALCRPGSLTLLGPELFIARPALWLRALGRTRAVVSPAPNFAYALCVERVTDADMEGIDLSAWKIAMNGAEPVSPATLRRFVERFARWGLHPHALTPVYGLAEATLAVTFSPIHAPFHTARFDRDALADGRVLPAPDGVELVSVGAPLPGIEVDAPEDAPGPVKVRGASVMSGYLHQPERTQAAIVDGWLDTGDVGFLHGGELYLTGRVKDLLIVRGRNHAPHEVEQAVDAVEGVRTGCAAAAGWQPEDAEEERIVVFVERAQGKPAPSSDACRKAILEATGLRVDDLVILEAGTLPRTSSGKIRRGEALRRWRAGELDAPEAVTAWMLAGAAAKGTFAHWRAKRST